MAQVETGPILDVVPYVLADGYTINLTIMPSLTEFLGYATPPEVPDVTGTNNRVQLPVILPQFRLRQMTASLNLWDNQTVVVGGMSAKSIFKYSTPVLGSLPGADVSQPAYQ
jgi:type II secretory pathway component GspD/PulD (secretin)